MIYYIFTLFLHFYPKTWIPVQKKVIPKIKENCCDVHQKLKVLSVYLSRLSQKGSNITSCVQYVNDHVVSQSAKNLQWTSVLDCYRRNMDIEH